MSKSVKNVGFDERRSLTSSQSAAEVKCHHHDIIVVVVINIEIITRIVYIGNIVFVAGVLSDS